MKGRMIRNVQENDESEQSEPDHELEHAFGGQNLVKCLQGDCLCVWGLFASE